MDLSFCLGSLVVCGDPSSPCQVGGSPAYVLHFNNKTYPVVLGRSGVSVCRSEGDGSTPAGLFRLRRVFYNPERVAAPPSGLPVVPLHREDGWCDEPGHPQYNRLIKIPFSGSHETLWREDSLYDLVVEVGYNDDPIVPGMGSAIFIHLRPEKGNTEGCLALKKEDLLEIIPHLTPHSTLDIRP